MLDSNFLSHFSILEDPRVTNHNTRHKFLDIFILAFIGNLCGCDEWTEVEDFCNAKIDLFKSYLELPNGIPSHDTFGRVFSMIESEHLEELLISWMNLIFKKTKGEIIAIDGKTVCGSRKKHEHKGIHLVNAWACQNKLTLGTLKVDKKTNEITAIMKILGMLNISGCTITIDAMGCQKKIAKKIIDNKANYVLCAKDNQKWLKIDIDISFKLNERHIYQHSTDTGFKEEKHHGRVEARKYLTLPAEYFPKLQEEWPGIKSVAKVIRRRTIEKKTSEEVNYYISSHSYISKQIPEAIRKHWNVENCLHWQLDVSFNEDNCRARIKNEAENIAILRRISMAFLKKNKYKAGIKRKRKRAGWDDSFLFEVLNEGLNTQN